VSSGAAEKRIFWFIFCFSFFGGSRHRTWVAARAKACGGRGEFEACIKLSSAVIEFGLDGLLSFDFNGDNFLGAIF
jgi:hypothetical protein